MQLTVLGAGPAYTDRPGATGASYLVEAAGTAILLDLGQGSFPRLAAAIEPSGLDAVVVSHLHPDHFIDLIPLRHYLAYEFDPSRRLRVLGPANLADRIDALHARPGFTAEALDCVQLGSGQQEIGGITLESRLVTHTDESYGTRLSLPRSRAFFLCGHAPARCFVSTWNDLCSRFSGNKKGRVK